MHKYSMRKLCEILEYKKINKKVLTEIIKNTILMPWVNQFTKDNRYSCTGYHKVKKKYEW